MGKGLHAKNKFWLQKAEDILKDRTYFETISPAKRNNGDRPIPPMKSLSSKYPSFWSLYGNFIKGFIFFLFIVVLIIGLCYTLSVPTVP